MRENPKIFVVTADLGYKMWDDIKQKFPTRFLNVGAAESLMIGTCIGLSYQGYIPVAYSITPFLLYRGFESIRNYLSHERVPVKLLGSGLDTDYLHDGFSHHDFTYREILKLLDLDCITPNSVVDLKVCTENWLNSSQPSFLGLRR